MKTIILSIALFTLTLVSANTVNTPLNAFNTTYKYSIGVNSFCKLIQMGDYDAVKALVDDGIDVNQKSLGLTPLMYAARHNRAEITKLLIEHGAKLNVKSDKRGFTALKWAEVSNAKDTYAIIKKAIENKKKNKGKK